MIVIAEPILGIVTADTDTGVESFQTDIGASYSTFYAVDNGLTFTFTEYHNADFADSTHSFTSFDAYGNYGNGISSSESESQYFYYSDAVSTVSFTYSESGSSYSVFLIDATGWSSSYFNTIEDHLEDFTTLGTLTNSDSTGSTATSSSSSSGLLSGAYNTNIIHASQYTYVATATWFDIGISTTTTGHLVPTIFDTAIGITYVTVLTDSTISTTSSASYTVASISTSYFIDENNFYQYQTLYIPEFNALVADVVYTFAGGVTGVNYSTSDLFFSYPGTFTIAPLGTNFSSSEQSFSITTGLGTYSSIDFDTPIVSFDIPTITDVASFNRTYYVTGNLPMDSSTFNLYYSPTSILSNGGTVLNIIETLHSFTASATIAYTYRKYGIIPIPEVLIWNGSDGGISTLQYDSSTLTNTGIGTNTGPKGGIIWTYEDTTYTSASGHSFNYRLDPTIWKISSENQSFTVLTPTYLRGFQIAPNIQTSDPVWAGVGADVPMPWAPIDSPFKGMCIGTPISAPYEWYYKGTRIYGDRSFITSDSIYFFSFDSTAPNVPLNVTVSDGGIVSFVNNLFGIGDLQNSIATSQSTGTKFGGLPHAGGSHTLLLAGNWQVTDAIINAQNTIDFDGFFTYTAGDGQLSRFISADIFQFVDTDLIGFPLFETTPIAFDLYPDSHS